MKPESRLWSDLATNVPAEDSTTFPYSDVAIALGLQLELLDIAWAYGKIESLMAEALDFKVRVTGHDWAKELFKRQKDRGRIPQSLLITGPPHVGKGSLARYFAQYLNCRGEPQPCGDCLSCRKLISGNHPDIRVFDDDHAPLKIEQVRALQRELSLSPLEGQYRVALLCNFERATASAANALLKTLEEPAAPVVLILTASDPGGLLPTIVSRCQVLTLRPLPGHQLCQALQGQWGATPEQAELLAQLAVGRLGWAVRSLEDEEFLQRRAKGLADMLDLLAMPRAERLAYANSMSRNLLVLKEMLALWLVVWRDLLLLKSESTTKIVNLDWQDTLQDIAYRSTLSEVKEMIFRLQAALLNLDRNVNPRLNLEVVLLKLPSITNVADNQQG
jgi:DNA polymerase-3 subunit delta'